MIDDDSDMTDLVHSQNTIKTPWLCLQSAKGDAFDLQLSAVGRELPPVANCSGAGDAKDFSQSLTGLEVFDGFFGGHIDRQLTTVSIRNQQSKQKIFLNEGMELKDRIKEAMLGAGLRPGELAKKTGTTTGAVAHWLGGKTKSLKAETAQKIGSATGYNASWLVDGKGEKMLKPASAPRRMGDGLSPGAIEIAALYDLIPIGDQIKRVQAYNAATAAILAILEPARSTAVQATDQ